MTHYDDIYEIVADEYGIVAAAQACEAGATTGEMSRRCSERKFIRRSHGVYKLIRQVLTPYDAFAEAVALIGEGGYLWGKSALSLYGPVLAGPRMITVTALKRMRCAPLSRVKTVLAPSTERTISYERIPSQRAVDTIEICEASVMPERLINTVEQACREGLLTVGERGGLKEGLS